MRVPLGGVTHLSRYGVDHDQGRPVPADIEADLR